MNKDIAFDLKVARHRSGLSQRDLAHFLGVHRARISRLERGAATLSVAELCMLLLIYGRSFERLFSTVFGEVRGVLARRLETLPAAPETRRMQLGRTNSLNHLAARLEALHRFHHGSA